MSEHSIGDIVYTRPGFTSSNLGDENYGGYGYKEGLRLKIISIGKLPNVFDVYRFETLHYGIFGKALISEKEYLSKRRNETINELLK